MCGGGGRSCPFLKGPDGGPAASGSGCHGGAPTSRRTCCDHGVLVERSREGPVVFHAPGHQRLPREERKSKSGPGGDTRHMRSEASGPACLRGPSDRIRAGGGRRVYGGGIAPGVLRSSRTGGLAGRRGGRSRASTTGPPGRPGPPSRPRSAAGPSCRSKGRSRRRRQRPGRTEHHRQRRCSGASCRRQREMWRVSLSL